MDELQLIKRTEIKRRSITKPLIDSSPRNSPATVNRHGFELQGNNPQHTLGDISRGASFLTGLKASPDDPPPQMNSSWPIEVASEGGLLRPAAAYGYGNLQGRQISHMLASLAPHTMQSNMQQQMLLQNSQLMMQPQMSQECLSRGYRPPNNHSNYEMLNQMSTQQLIAMASRLNGGMNGMARMNGTSMNGMASMNGTGMVQARSLSGSSLTSFAEPRTVSGSSIMSSTPNAASNIFNKGNKTHEDQQR